MKNINRRTFITILIIILVLIIAAVILGTRGCKQGDQQDLSNNKPNSTVTTPAVATSKSSMLPSNTQPSTPTTGTQTTTINPTPNNPTPIGSKFQGLVIGNWEGRIIQIDKAISGIFKVTIDKNGIVQGSFEGDYSGSISGEVDLNGNLNATGTASGGTSPDITMWQGKLTISGEILSVQGKLSSPLITGGFSGKGNSISGFNNEPSVYRGSFSCNWSGQRINGTSLNGTFSFSIDANGNIEGSLDGSFPAFISGFVDLSGNMVAIGKTLGGTTTIGSTWSALVSVSGNSLEVDGRWESQGASGTFSGTGSDNIQ